MSALMLAVLFWVGLAPRARADSCEDLGGSVSTKDACVGALGGRYLWYNDADLDGYNAADVCCCPSSSTCDHGATGDTPDGYEGAISRTTVSAYQWDDCQDADEQVYPGATEIYYDGLDQDCGADTDFDQDGDGWYSEGYGDLSTRTPGTSVVVDDGSASLGDDCDDTNSDIYPGAAEIANGLDDDCDGLEDEGTSAYDDDGDCACEDEVCTGSASADCVVLLGGDCDDTDPDVAPDALEIWYDGVDEDCGGDSDYDQDADGSVPDAYVGLPTTAGGALVEPGDLPGGDCDDLSALVGATILETWYDGLDADCGGDDDYDQDADGYVPTEHVGAVTRGSDGAEIAGTGGLPGGDCDDTQAALSPGVAEIWYDGIDEDCDGACDFDQDGDGTNADEALLGGLTVTDTVGGEGVLVCASDALPGGDCDDEAADTYPGAVEIWYDGTDQDCLGDSDYDQDADGSVPDEYVGLVTTVGGGVVEAGALPGGDCDDASATVGPSVEETWYDGLDADCAGDDDYDQDADGYTPTVYAGLPTTDSAGAEVAGTGALPSDDCDDLDAAIHPGVAEIWYDGVDQDCDGACDYDQDGDGYNVSEERIDDEIRDTVWSDGTVVCASDALPGGDCVDDDETLFELDPFSAKDPASIHPDVSESCEAKDTVQIDDDCNGDTNTQGSGDDESYITSDWGTPYYQDADGDGQGNPDVYFYLCEEVDGFTTSFGDCDDTNSDVNPDAPEICNNQDEDCDGKIDEASSLGSESGCIDLYPDQDLDGYGSTASSTCMCYDGSSDECGDGYEYNDEDETCYTRTYGDCYDYDESIHPLEDDEPLVEYLDGNDNDCNREVPLVELDCDDDGSLPLLPVALDASAPVARASDLGLTDCRGPSEEADPDCCARNNCEDGETCDDLDLTEFITCWDDYRLRLKCDEDTGLIVVSLVADGVAERFDGGRRLYSEGRACSTAGDCDDHCPARCPDAAEVCDGVDNDCDASEEILDDRDLDGLPDSLDEDAAVPGHVNVRELDLDADGYLGCSAGDLLERDQDAISVASCAPSDAIGDCDDTCSLASPAAEEERCDAFLNVCEGEGEGSDADRDRYLTCGAWGPEDGELAEDIYALVYVPGGAGQGTDTADTADSADTSGGGSGAVVPLLPPREGAPECDAQLSQALAPLVGQQALDQVTEDGDTEPLLRLCVAAEACAQIRAGADLSWPADCAGIDGACTVARLTLEPSADDDLYEPEVVAGLDEVADCSSHPEQLITRTVWSQARVLAARALVVQWDCFRLDGGYGCGDLRAPDGWETPFPDGAIEGGNAVNADPGDALTTDARWWKELGRYHPEPMLSALLVGCWGPPEPGAEALEDVLSDRTGGDCADGSLSANRGEAEGPDDLLGIYAGDPASCATCTDGVDNNCNGLMDCAEPACARCFVGQGSGCGGGEQSPCAEGGCVSAPRDGLSDPNVAALVGMALAALASRARRRT